MRFFLLITLGCLLAGGATAQTKTTLSTSSLTTLTGTASRTALVDAQSAVTVYGTWATNTSVGVGTSATVTQNAVVRITFDSTKTYKNLFVNLTGNARIKVLVSTDNSTYTQIAYPLLSSNGKPAQWRTVPLNRPVPRSIRYMKLQFTYRNSRCQIHEIAVTK